MRIDVFTIFPDMVTGFAGLSLLGRASRAGLLDLRVHDLRAGASDPHRSVDDTPFGGGPGMVLMPEPLFAAVEAADPPRPLLLLGPGGDRFDQARARELATGDGFSLLCGRYEGVDERVRRHLVDGEVSVGDYVLAGGEVAAMAVHGGGGAPRPRGDGQRPVGRPTSPSPMACSSTRSTPSPATFRAWTVPEVLRSGDHGRVDGWRRAQALRATLAARPDLIEARGGLSEDDQRLLDEFDPDS